MNNQVIKSFGMELKNYKKVWGIYLCDTDQGVKVVQPVRMKEERIWFQHSAKEHVHQQGFTQFSRFYLSQQQTPYYTQGRKTYVMEDWKEGEELDFTDFNKVKKATELLGRFHGASKGMRPVQQAEIIAARSAVPDQMKKRTKEIRRFRKRIYEHPRLSDFDLLFIRYYAYYYGLAVEALTLLEQPTCQHWIQSFKEDPYVCHGDFTHHNIVVREDELWLKDFSKCTYQNPLYEFTCFVNKTMQKAGFNPEYALEMFNIYKAHMDHDEGLEQLFLSLLIFPEDFLKYCNLYYNQRRGNPSTKYVEKMSELVKGQEEHKKFIIEMKKSLL